MVTSVPLQNVIPVRVYTIKFYDVDEDSAKFLFLEMPP